MATLSKGLKPFHEYERVVHYGGPSDAWKRVVDEYTTIEGERYLKRTVVPLTFQEFMAMIVDGGAGNAEQAR